MTVLVGVRCSDGVVIGADSAQTSAAGNQPVMQVTGGVKLEMPFDRLITASTGAAGLSQRFHHVMADLLQGKEIDKWIGRPPVDLASKLAELTIKEFERTKSPLQTHPQVGWGFGALLGYVSDKYGPQLVEFDHLQFHPELKGLEGNGGELKSKPFATMGSGQTLADPFIAHAHRVLFGESRLPSLKQGRLLVTWTLQHVLKYATGHVGGELRIAEISQNGASWKAARINVEEAQQQVQEIEAHIGQFGSTVPAPNADLTDLAAAAPGAPHAAAPAR